MVPLRRPPMPPRILGAKASVWSQQYLAECQQGKKPRPRSDRYGHPDVRTELMRMSHNKCFYCERKLSEDEVEVDHYIEVAERPDLAFDWGNLYLSCEPCNKKKEPNLQTPVADCVNPCDPSQTPSQHLSFTAECIDPRDERGRDTIKKYCLNRDGLDLQRGRLLRQFLEKHNEILARMLSEGRAQMSDAERESLGLYRDPSRPFSLMMHVHLSRAGL